MKDLIIFPYNGNAVEAVDCILEDYRLIGFVDDVSEKHGTSFTNHFVMGREAFEKYKNAEVLAVPGGPATYLNKSTQIASLNLPENRYARVVHPSAHISKYSTLGFNVLVMAGVIITPRVTIGNHVCILPQSVIHHESIIEDYCWIGSRVVIAGNVQVRRNCFIGSGSTLINNIEVGENTLTGIGTNVIRSLPPNEKVVGNPARSLKL